MSDVFGLTDQGFVPKTLDVIRAEIEARFRAKYGLGLPLGDETVEGQMIGVQAEREQAIWQLLEILYGTFDPDKASGQALRALSLVTGTIPPPATFSAVTLTLTGDPATAVAEGSQSQIPDTDRSWQTTEDVTIAAAAAWLPTHAYAIGDVATNDGNVYAANTAGVSGASGGPVHTVRSTPNNPVVILPDGAVNWIWLGAGTGVVAASARATVTGPLEGVAYAIEQIVTPVGGWLGVVNREDASLGADEFKDAELRILREVELARGGTGTIPSVRSALLRIAEVISATVFYNSTNLTNVDGVPPHSVEAVVRGGDDQTIFDALFENVPIGIGTVGNTIGAHVDSEHVSHDFKFSRPEQLAIYVQVDVVKDPNAYPSDGAAQIKAAIVTYGDDQQTGKNAVASALVAQCFSVEGVLEATVKISLTPGPTLSATLAVNLRQIAVFDTSRIDVTAVDGVP